jgi:PAS domain S-box-containing protein
MKGDGIAPTGRPADRSLMDFWNTAVVDHRGHFVEWSSGAEQLLGYSSDILGRSATDLLVEWPTPAATKVWESKAPWSSEVELRHHDGHSVTVELLAVPRTGVDGAPQWALVAVAGAERCSREGNAVMEWAFNQSLFPAAIFDGDGRLLRLSDAGAGVLGVSEEQARGLRLTEFLPGAPYTDIEELIRTVFRTGKPENLKAYVRTPGDSRPHAWIVFVSPLKEEVGRVHSVWVSSLDVTEEDQARERLALLDEASARIGTTLDVERTAKELSEVTIPRFADASCVDLLEWVLSDEEPLAGLAPGEFLLRRVACRRTFANSDAPALTLGGTRTHTHDSPAGRCLAAGVPLLMGPESADFDHWVGHFPPPVGQTRDSDIDSVMAVPLRARGYFFGLALFARRSRPDRFSEGDLVLAGELAARATVSVDNARRYMRQRATAVALQRSLLPRRLPSQSAVEVASRYLPADSGVGVGGDWFDVIPLSGARVALVVGDVVGHGIHASATMAGLRTAVRTLADVDLSPDELLTHLDDVVISWSVDDDLEESGGISGEIGATCLYAVYDPISGLCTIARAGHMQPAVVSPDGSVYFLDLPGGPPLGLGGLPFETTTVELPKGSLLVLFTDGLVESGDRDLDRGLGRLRHALASAAGSLEAICDDVLNRMLSERSADDIALLIARTRTLDADRVATWELPADPAVVAMTRKQATDQLTSWGLDDVIFTAELIVSELVTNAIRYGRAPIVLRLIHDHSLIIEVSDTSTTSPHLRRARAFDEGGRGLFLVAQLSQRWGTRQASAGKTIWAECPLS